ncbi:MAG: LptF/LptG family permease, partial [Longimicrobiales bacterium]
PGGPSMPKLTTRQLLGRHITPFAISFASLTILLLASDGARRVLDLRERGFAAGRMVEALLLGVPHTVALTIPMAVYLAVLLTFTRLGAEGLLATARRERHGVRRLVAPVLGATAVIAALTFVSNAELVPRANARLSIVLSGAPVMVDRTMTLGELREAAQTAQAATGADAALRAAGYQVEIQKKFALAAACVFLALFGASAAIRFPRGGIGLVLGASATVFIGYYILLIMGETLAERQGLSPLVAMWSANAILLAVALLLVRRPRRFGPTGGIETLAING